jgi:hypothetical protein
LLLVILIRFLGRLSFWTAVLATPALFGTTAIMALLFWGLFAWFNENAPAWQRTFSQASAFFLIAVNGAGVFLGPLALVAARSARRAPDFSEPFWVRGWWQPILVVGLLLTLSAFLAAAWEPRALDVLDGWWELCVITNIWLSATGLIAVAYYFEPPGRGRGGYRSQIYLLRFLHGVIFVRTALMLVILCAMDGAVFGTKAGPADDRPQMLEVLVWTELILSLLLVASPSFVKLGRGFFVSGLTITALAFVSAWHRALHPLDGAPPLGGWYAIWLTAVPLALSLYTAVQRFLPRFSTVR